MRCCWQRRNRGSSKAPGQGDFRFGEVFAHKGISFFLYATIRRGQSPSCRAVWARENRVGAVTGPPRAANAANGATPLAFLEEGRERAVCWKPGELALRGLCSGDGRGSPGSGVRGRPAKTTPEFPPPFRSSARPARRPKAPCRPGRRFPSCARGTGRSCRQAGCRRCRNWRSCTWHR